MTDLAAIYRELADRCSGEQLADAYRTAYARGEQDLPTTERTSRPVALLATVIPRLVTLAVAIYAVHILPHTDSPERTALDDELLATIEAAAAGSLRRCHLALEADGCERGYAADEWLSVISTVAVDALRDASATAEPPPIVQLSQDAARWTAVAIEALDENSASVTEPLSDALGRLLLVFMFGDIAREQTRAAHR